MYTLPFYSIDFGQVRQASHAIAEKETAHTKYMKL